MAHRHEEEWSELTGLRRATVAFIVRSGLWLLIWCGLLWLVMPALNGLTEFFAGRGMLAGFLLVGGPAGLFGLVMGYGLSRRISEIAGFSGPLLTVIGAACAVAALWGGAEIVWLDRPTNGWPASMAVLSACLFAAVWIVKGTLFET